MRWLRIRKGYTGVTLRNAKILQIIQITSLLDKKSSKISSKTTVSADKISSLVLFTIKSNLKCVTPASLDAGKPPVQWQTGVGTGNSPGLSEGLIAVAPTGASAMWLGLFLQGFSGFGWSNPFFFFRSWAGVRNRDHSGWTRVSFLHLFHFNGRMPTWTTTGT